MVFGAARSIDHRFGARGRFLVHKRRIGGSRYSNSFASGATLYNNEGKIEPLKIPALSAVVNQSRPEARGSIHIRTAEASDAPEIHANYLSADLDRQTIIKGVRLLLDIFSAEPLQDHLTGRLSPGPDIDTSSDDELLEYIRGDASTVYHPTSTCSIGKVVTKISLYKAYLGCPLLMHRLCPT